MHLRKVENDLNYLLEILRTAQWVDDFLNNISIAKYLTKQQVNELEKYSNNPSEFLSKFFIIDEDGFDISENIDIYPPESFMFSSFVNLLRS